MPAYMLFIREKPVRDQEALATYQSMNQASIPAFAPYKLKALAVYGETEGIEGEAPDGTIILEFPSVEDAKSFYYSPEYQDALPHRIKAADYRAFIVQGL